MLLVCYYLEDYVRHNNVVDINELRRKHVHDPFHGSKSFWEIDPLEPSTSVLVSVPQNTQQLVVQFYCERYGEVVETNNQGGGKFIVSYKNSAGKLMRNDIMCNHRWGSCIVYPRCNRFNFNYQLGY